MPAHRSRRPDDDRNRARSDAVVRAMTEGRIDVTDDPERRQYEIRLDGEVAGIAAYRRGPGVVTFTHTEIDPAMGGHGFGSALAAAALDNARARGETVVPVCPFIRGWIERHPDYADLVATS